MRKVSKSQLARMALAGQARRDFVEGVASCMACGQARATECHKIACGDASYGERLAWLAVCRACSCDRLMDGQQWPVARQLAIKWLRDREHFNLVRFNALRAGNFAAIAWSEVCTAICREVDSRRTRPAHEDWPGAFKQRIFELAKEGYHIETLSKALSVPIDDIVDYLRTRNLEIKFRNRAWGSRFIALPREETCEYLPTPEEIARKCKEIQSEWTSGERASRTRRPERLYDLFYRNHRSLAGCHSRRP